MVIPVKYRKSSERLVNYDFEDLIQNQAIAVFFIGSAKSSEGEENIMGRNTFYSNSTIETLSKTQGEGVTSEFTKLGEKNYDFLIGSSLILGGIALIDMKYNLTVDQGSGTVIGSSTIGEVYGKIIIKKIHNGVSTEFGYVVTPTYFAQSSGSPNTLTERRSFKISIPNTNFYKGDIIRITFEGWGRLTSYKFASDLVSFSFYTDPTGRDASSSTLLTTFLARLPFVSQG